MTVHFENAFPGGALCDRRPNECLVTIVPAYVTCVRCLRLLPLQRRFVTRPGDAANDPDKDVGAEE